MSIWNLSGFNLGPNGEHRPGSAATQAEVDYGPDVDKVGGSIKPLHERPYVALDIETLGLHPLAPITEIGLCHSDRGEISWKVHPGVSLGSAALSLEELSGKASPDWPYVDHAAVELTSYNDEEWKGAPLFSEICKDLWSWLADDHPILVGWNITTFDWPRLSWRFKSLGFNADRIGRVIVDVMAMSACMIPKRISDLKLDTTTAYFGGEEEGVHRAIGGARRAKFIFEQFRRGGERVFQ